MARSKPEQISKAFAASFFLSASAISFFFPDIVEAASYYKIGYLVQPAGSKMDSSVVELCDKKNIAMLQTGIRHFLH